VPGRPDIVNAGSRETGYSELQGPGRPVIVKSGETRYNEWQGPGRRTRFVNAGSGRPDIVNAGSVLRPDIMNCRVRGLYIGNAGHRETDIVRMQGSGENPVL
ncbi:unnamed protein product, partial [Staurois parvus]